MKPAESSFVIRFCTWVACIIIATDYIIIIVHSRCIGLLKLDFAVVLIFFLIYNVYSVLNLSKGWFNALQKKIYI